MSKPADEQLIVGRNPVREALEHGAPPLDRLLLQQGTGGRALDDLRRLAAAAGVKVQYVPVRRLDQLAPGLVHQGVAAYAAPFAYLDVDTLLTRIAPTLDEVRRRRPLVLVLDQIEDPHNFGAILRTAVAMGVDGVVVPERRMAPLSPAAVKASAGLAGRIPIARAVNLAQVLEQLKERGYWVAGAAGDGETTVWEMDWARPLALVMGSEGKGLRPRVAAACDYRVAIPMPGPAESLNVSVATGMLLLAATRARQEQAP